MSRLAALFFVLFAVAGQPALAETLAALSGRVLFDGEPPRRRAIRMDADPTCASLHQGRVLADRVLVSEDGGLANVFVYLEDPPEGSYSQDVPSESATLTQVGCVYQPHVQGLRVKQKLEIVNQDPTLHNVRSLAEHNRPFNLSQPENGRRTKVFPKAELAVKFKCDVHSWMSAYLFVMEHPFFATADENGRFEIRNLPAGRHTFVAWHEELGEQRFTVEIGTEPAAVELQFSR